MNREFPTNFKSVETVKDRGSDYIVLFQRVQWDITADITLTFLLLDPEDITEYALSSSRFSLYTGLKVTSVIWLHDDTPDLTGCSPPSQNTGQTAQFPRRASFSRYSSMFGNECADCIEGRGVGGVTHARTALSAEVRLEGHHHRDIITRLTCGGASCLPCVHLESSWTTWVQPIRAVLDMNMNNEPLIFTCSHAAQDRQTNTESMPLVLTQMLWKHRGSAPPLQNKRKRQQKKAIRAGLESWQLGTRDSSSCRCSDLMWGTKELRAQVEERHRERERELHHMKQTLRSQSHATHHVSAVTVWESRLRKFNRMSQPIGAQSHRQKSLSAT